MEPLVPLAGVSQAPDINAFVLQTGRLPKIGDQIVPWQYRGWLLYQVQFADSHPMLPGRWTHYLRTLEAGRLLDEPIPRVEFVLGNLDAGRKMLEHCLRLIHREDYSWTSFHRLVDWLAWGLAVSREVPPLKEETHEALYRTFNLEPLLLNPHDYLGWMLAERHSNGWNPNAFFPTPHPVVECMTQMMMAGREPSNGRDSRLETVMDPCVGTGRMLLHASNYSYCLYGCDIDPLVAMIIMWNQKSIAKAATAEHSEVRVSPLARSVAGSQGRDSMCRTKMQAVVGELNTQLGLIVGLSAARREHNSIGIAQ